MANLIPKETKYGDFKLFFQIMQPISDISRTIIQFFTLSILVFSYYVINSVSLNFRNSAVGISIFL